MIKYIDLGPRNRGLLSGIVCRCGLEVKDIVAHHRTEHSQPIEAVEMSYYHPGGTWLAASRPKITTDELRAIGIRAGVL